jgi:hypothetical protein
MSQEQEGKIQMRELVRSDRCSFALHGHCRNGQFSMLLPQSKAYYTIDFSLYLALMISDVVWPTNIHVHRQHYSLQYNAIIGLLHAYLEGNNEGISAYNLGTMKILSPC